MPRLSYPMLATLLTMITPLAHAETGETWQITTKTEMAGMPYAMPETTITICMPKKDQQDPRHMTQQDDSCKVTNIKQSGSKTTWKMRCNKEGQKMTGNGEITHGKGSYHGKTHMRGTTDGEKFEMTATYRGKRIGKACDTEKHDPTGGKMEGMKDLKGMFGF